MSSNNRLSHSQINKWLFCPTAWKNHYILRYRPLEVSSALLFGSAIGKTFEYMLINNTGKVFIRKDAKIDISNLEGVGNIIVGDTKPELLYANEYEFFDYQWSHQEINGQLTNIQTYPHVAYSKYDTDYDLLSKKDFAVANNDPNMLAWLSLRAKAHLIIDSFKKNLLPIIEDVYSVEELIELSNDEGDSSIGYADAVLKLKGHDKPIILDFKTAAREYELDSVVKSVQLSQYVHVLGEKYDTRLCGYAVFLKNMDKNRTKICTVCGFDGSDTRHKTCNNEIKGKRCGGEWKETLKPECRMQLIIDELPQSTEDFVIENIESVNAAIKTGIYTKNVNGCTDNGFGRKCEFYDVCWNKDASKYVQLEEKEK